VTNAVVEFTWTPTIHHVYFTAGEVIHANVSWEVLHTKKAIKEIVPIAWLNSTIRSMNRNFAYDLQLLLRQFARLNSEYCPYTYVWPKALQSISSKYDSDTSDHPDGFHVPPVQHVYLFIRRLVATNEEATIVILRWTNTNWYATAIRACFEYRALFPLQERDTTSTRWAMLGCLFLHCYDD